MALPSHGDCGVHSCQDSSLVWARTPGGEEGSQGVVVFARLSVKPDVSWPGVLEANGASQGRGSHAEPLLPGRATSPVPRALVDRRSGGQIGETLRSPCIPKLNSVQAGVRERGDPTSSWGHQQETGTRDESRMGAPRNGL